MKKQTYTKKKLDTNNYVNIETGETLASEQPNITSTNQVNGDYVKFKSVEFYIIDSNAISHLNTILSKSDMAYVHLMCGMVRGMYNYLHDKNNTTHNKQSLMIDLELARNAFGRLIARLNKQGVIMETKGHKDGKAFKYIMLNPNLARRTNTIHKECSELFQTFSKPMKPSKEYDK